MLPPAPPPEPLALYFVSPGFPLAVKFVSFKTKEPTVDIQIIPPPEPPRPPFNVPLAPPEPSYLACLCE